MPARAASVRPATMLESPLVQLTAHVHASAPDRRELQQALVAWVRDVRHGTDPVEAHVFEDLESATAFCVVAVWPDRVALEAHVRSPAFGTLLGALDILAVEATFGIADVHVAGGREDMTAVRRGRASLGGRVAQADGGPDRGGGLAR